MKKTHRFNELSDKKCKETGCRKFLKKRLVESKEPHKITRCYAHDLVIRRAKQNEKNKR